MNADPRVMQYIADVHDRATAFRSMCAYFGRWRFRGYGPWPVEERATGAFVGRAGMMRWEPWWTWWRTRSSRGGVAACASEMAARTLRYAQGGGRGVLERAG